MRHACRAIAICFAVSARALAYAALITLIDVYALSCCALLLRRGAREWRCCRYECAIGAMLRDMRWQQCARYVRYGAVMAKRDMRGALLPRYADTR